MFTLNVPHANTRPSSKMTAVWESPADICATGPSKATFPGVKELSSVAFLPKAPSSSHPNVYTSPVDVRHTVCMPPALMSTTSFKSATWPKRFLSKMSGPTRSNRKLSYLQVWNSSFIIIILVNVYLNLVAQHLLGHMSRPPLVWFFAFLKFQLVLAPLEMKLFGLQILEQNKVK